MTSEELLFALRARFDEQADVPLVVKIGKDHKYVFFAGIAQMETAYAFELRNEESALSQVLNEISLAYITYGKKPAFIRTPQGIKGIVKISEKRSFATKYNSENPAVILEIEI
jgi:hypothetical protein